MCSRQVAGVAERPQASKIKRCDSAAAQNNPAETPENPAECRTESVAVEVLRESLRALREHRDHLSANVEALKYRLGNCQASLTDLDRDIAAMEAAIHALTEPPYCPDLARLADDGGRA